jgi:hypothetical protein
MNSPFKQELIELTKTNLSVKYLFYWVNFYLVSLTNE